MPRTEARHSDQCIRYIGLDLSESVAVLAIWLSWGIPAHTYHSLCSCLISLMPSICFSSENTYTTRAGAVLDQKTIGSVQLNKTQ